jgi:IstB-like ATP binding protein
VLVALVIPFVLHGLGEGHSYATRMGVKGNVNRQLRDCRVAIAAIDRDDDWGLSTLTHAEQRDLLEVLEDRHQRASIIITCQVPVAQWHEIIGSPTLADAIMDRLVLRQGNFGFIASTDRRTVSDDLCRAKAALYPPAPGRKAHDMPMSADVPLAPR